MSSIFTEISLILVVATILAGVMQLLRQPLIIGHIITGIILGPSVFNLVKSSETIDVFSQFGIALLLFVIGLSLNPKVIKEVGRTSLITGVGQVLFTSLIGYFVGLSLGFGALESLYIAVALTFSSTIIILKLLADKKELGRLYGKISTGFLLIQDIIATIILVAVTALSSDKPVLQLVTETTLKGVGLGLLVVAVSNFFLPRLSSFFARSQEFLYLFAIGWGFGLAALFAAAGFSVEIGALFAGVALASSPFSYEISARMRPLRDFFIVLFFILLGSHLAFGNISSLLLPTIVFSVLVLVGNPLVVMILMAAMGYTKRTGFKAGLAVAQISEFSLILVVLGNRVGHISADAISLITIVALITIAISAYMIMYSDQLYNFLSPALGVFEPRGKVKEHERAERREVFLFGYRNGDKTLVEAFRKLGRPYLVVDYDPEVIERLSQERITCRYGDAKDPEFLEELNLSAARLVVINLTDHQARLAVARLTRENNPDTIIITLADSQETSDELYEVGATLVVMPHQIGSEQIAGLVTRHEFNARGFAKERLA